ncbi:MAG: nitrogenase component 1 [Alkaliphilus sp.]
MKNYDNSANANYDISILDLTRQNTKKQMRLLPKNCLQYVSTSAGGWGIIRTQLLVPDSIVLFAAPSGCGRHGAISAIQHGYKKRFFILQVDEVDIVTGRHLERIPQAINEILRTIDVLPKAIFVTNSCIDHLLASDYESIALELEVLHKIPVMIGRMNPITMGGKMPPQLTVQQGVYGFLKASGIRRNGVNIIGNFANIEDGSEFRGVIDNAGLGAVNHISSCKTFEEFQLMSRAKYNILIKPLGKLAVARMEKEFGIPFIYSPLVFGIDSVDKMYQKLESFFKVNLDTEKYRDRAKQAVDFYKRKFGSITISIGSTVNANQFELARALTECGFNVTYIFSRLVMVDDWEYIEWLKEYSPRTRVIISDHPNMANFLQKSKKVDLAIGFDAGYFCDESKTVPLTFDTQLYGYSAIISLLKEMDSVYTSPQDFKKQLYDEGMVI